jgi:hypothetical protein
MSEQTSGEELSRRMGVVILLSFAKEQMGNTNSTRPVNLDFGAKGLNEKDIEQAAQEARALAVLTTEKDGAFRNYKRLKLDRDLACNALLMPLRPESDVSSCRCKPSRRNGRPLLRQVAFPC